MSDRLFFKRLGRGIWLGLCLPGNLALKFRPDGSAEVSPDWSYGKAVFPNNLVEVKVPVLAVLAHENDVLPTEAWATLPEPAGTELPAPFAKLQEYIDTMAGSADLNPAQKTANRDLSAKLQEVQGNVSLPLRLLQAYRDLDPRVAATGLAVADSPAAIDDALRDLVRDAMGLAAGKMAIELFSGRLFVARTEGDKPPDEMADMLVDPVRAPSTPAVLAIAATQRADRIVFGLAIGADAPLTNGSIVGVIEGLAVGTPATHAAYYRLTRSLGIDERPSMRSGLIIIPTTEPEGSARASPDIAPWAKRPFQPSDAIGDALAGELLNYRIELFNLHGRCTHAGRLMVARQPMNRPDPPLQGSSRLIVNPDGEPLDLVVRVDLPPGEVVRDPASGLPGLASTDIVVYGQSVPLVPTGFYGDADDAALAIGRLLSDVDPASVLASGVVSHADAPDRGLSDDSRLSAAGLVELTHCSKPTFRTTASSARGKPAGEVVDPDDELEWEVAIGAGPLSRDRIGHGLRLFVALRRRVKDGVLQGSQQAPESTVVPLAMNIVRRDAASKELVIAIVQHLEPFWEQRNAPPPLKAHEAEILERPLPDGAVPEPAVVTVVIHHAAIAADKPLSIGGYRVWMRNAAMAEAEAPWQTLAIVQALPPLVKAYAAIETGRAWHIDKKTELSAANAVAGDIPESSTTARRDFLALDGNPLHRTAVATDAVFNDAQFQAIANLDGAVLLGGVKKLAQDGGAAEFVLSVARRRRLERGDDTDLPTGNWVFLRDQNGRFFGRAWQFFGQAGAMGGLKTRYVLVEKPNAQDTVGIDDFGDLTWTWRGIQDLWGHDLAWKIEPLGRHAPLLNRIAQTPDPDAESKGESTVLEDGVRYTVGDGASGRDAAITRLHRIQRRKRLDVPLGIVQHVDAKEDRFVFRVMAPAPFHRSTHNTVALAAYGVTSIRLGNEKSEFLHREAFSTTDPAVVTLMKVWVGTPEETQEIAPDEKVWNLSADDPVRELQGEIGRLAIDQPACFAISFELAPLADGRLDAAPTPVLNARRLQRPLPAATRFENNEELEGDRPTLAPGGPGGQSLDIPLCRLDWSYSGQAVPTLAQAYPELGEMKNAPLLRLPDPAAEAIVFWRPRGTGARFRPIARFRGPQVTGGPQVFTIGPWGSIWFDPAVLKDARLNTLAGSSAGKFEVVLLKKAEASDLYVQWRRDGSATMLAPRATV